MPCLAKAPRPWTTWQRPHRPRPPHVESMSRPRARPASRPVVPAGKRPRFPDGVKMTSGSTGAAIGRSAGGGGPGIGAGTAATAVDPPAALAFRGGLAVGPDPATGVLVVAHEH